MFPLLGVFFLDHLLELVHFLALLCKRLLCGIGFLSAFLSGAEFGFFRSIFLEHTAITSIVRCVRAPMLLAKVAVFLGTSFLWDSGVMVSTRLLSTLLFTVRSFLVARSVGFFGSFLALYVGPQIGMNPKPVWGCPRFGMSKNPYPNRFGDPQTNMGIGFFGVFSVTHKIAFSCQKLRQS
jgi:hypothetical protein